jgi:hypothetical protein
MPGIWGIWRVVEKVVTWGVLGLAAWLGGWVGVRGAYGEYGRKEDL